MPIIFELLYALTENLVDILIAVSSKYLLHILQNQFTSNFKIFSSTFMKMFLILHEY